MADGRYVTLVDFKKYVRSETTIDDGLYLSALQAAEAAVDNALGRKMVVASASTARVFRPAGGAVLWLDDFTTASPVIAENGTTLTINSDYVLEPLNGLSAGGEAVPYNRAVRYGIDWYCDYPKATVSVTAAWGWAAIPPQVVEGCKVVAKAILEGRDIKHGLVALAESGGVGERDAKVVKDMIRDYRSHKSWGIA